MLARTSLLILPALLLASPAAFAKRRPAAEPQTASQPTREAREREARKACLEGDYAKGVALLSDLFLDFREPNYIFNQGRCYEQNARFEEAIQHFREYLRTGSADKAVAEKHITECEALLQTKVSPAGPPTPLPAGPPTPLPAAEPAPPPRAPSVQPQAAASLTQTPSAAHGSGVRVAGAVVAAVGVAGLVTGFVLNMKANSVASTIDPPNHTFNRNTEATRQSYETSSWIGYGAGAAGLAAGVILYIVGRHKGGSEKNIAWVPTLGPGQAGAMFEGSF